MVQIRLQRRVSFLASVINGKRSSDQKIYSAKLRTSSDHEANAEKR